jgi:hypothetical protein
MYAIKVKLAKDPQAKLSLFRMANSSSLLGLGYGEARRYPRPGKYAIGRRVGLTRACS